MNIVIFFAHLNTHMVGVSFCSRVGHLFCSDLVSERPEVMEVLHKFLICVRFCEEFVGFELMVYKFSQGNVHF